MKRVVLVVGGVETLEYFAYQIGKTLEKEGYLTFYYDLKKVADSNKILKKFNKYGETMMLTFNFEGLSKEAGIYMPGKGYIWQEYDIPCYNIAVDHPYYYHKRLVDMPKVYYHISIDRYHEAYFKEYYPCFKHLGFLPLAGTEIAGVAKSSIENEKHIDVIMTGNYTPPSFSEQYIHQKGQEYAEFYQGIIDELIREPHKTLEEVAVAHCTAELGEVSRESMSLVIHNMLFIDLYIRSYWRGEVVKTLVEAGIHVDVIGKGWDELACDEAKKATYLHIHPQTTSEECLRQISQSKLSLNVMPWFKDGAHDRVFNSILNGTVSVTDTSKYLCEELPEGQGVCYYELDKLELLPDKVRKLLEDDESRENILKQGYEVITANHTWEARTKQMLRWIES